jgi:hypothetical protein
MQVEKEKKRKERKKEVRMESNSRGGWKEKKRERLEMLGSWPDVREFAVVGGVPSSASKIPPEFLSTDVELESTGIDHRH